MRLLLAVLAVFAGVFASDFLIHGVWLTKTYQATMSLWRPEAEMQQYFVFLLLGQFLASLAFVIIWSKGFPAVASFGGSILYGLVMGLFSQAYSLIMYAVQPLPGSLIGKWFIAGLAQGALMGAIVFLVGRPKSQPGK